MRTLIIATSVQPKHATEEILMGKRPRLEYIELARKLDSDYVDYNSAALSNAALVRQMEELLKLDIFWARKLAKKVRQEGYDVVLSMSERIGIPLAHYLDNGVRHCVITHHPLSPAKLRLLKLLGSFQHVDKVLPLSDAEKKVLQKELRLREDQVETVRYAIDTEYYRPIAAKAEWPESPERFILSLGLSKRDYPTLIEALRHLPDVQCEICATSAWDDYDLGIREDTLPANVRMVDYDHPEVIRDAYARCAFVVIPLETHTSQWTSGSASVLQPQAMGKPVIATCIPGMYDYLQDGKTGILVKGSNPKAMAQAIERLWDNPEETAKMGACAMEWVQENYSYKRWVNDIRRVIGARGSGTDE